MHTDVLPRLPWRPFEAEILGLEPDELDPVTIIVAAQLRLRGHRRRTGGPRGAGSTSDEVRRIVSARDSLLKRAVARGRSNTVPEQSPALPDDRGLCR